MLLKKLKKQCFKVNNKYTLTKQQIDRRVHNSNTANDITDLNINKRITKFKTQLKDEFVYRVPLQYFTDIGKIKFCLKIDFRIKCHLETEIKKLFQSKKK